MSALATEVLNGWRQAEQLLRLVPPDAPERAAVVEVVDRFRVMYLRLMDRADATRQRIDMSEADLDEAFALLREARAHIDHRRPSVTDGRRRAGPGSNHPAATDGARQAQVSGAAPAIRLRFYPHDDEAFARQITREVRAATRGMTATLDDLGASLGDVASSMRGSYPNLRLVVQEPLASDGSGAVIVYAYRDGHALNIPRRGPGSMTARTRREASFDRAASLMAAAERAMARSRRLHSRSMRPDAGLIFIRRRTHGLAWAGRNIVSGRRAH